MSPRPFASLSSSSCASSSSGRNAVARGLARFGRLLLSTEGVILLGLVAALYYSRAG